MKLIDTLSKKIGLGYFLIMLVLAIAVSMTIVLTQKIDQASDRLINEQAPAARMSLEALNGVNHAMAALRGWVLMQEPSFRQEGAEAWEKEIKVSINTLVSQSASWIAIDNITRLNEVRPKIERLEKYHDRIERLTLTDIDSAAFLMEEKAAPLASEVGDVLLAMTNDQEALMNTESEDIKQQMAKLEVMEWSVLGAGVLISIFLGSVITRSISKPISKAVQDANRIASGDLESEINISGSKELKVLGNALANMQASIREKTRATEKNNWITLGQNKLNEAVRGDKSMEDLAKVITQFIAEYTHSRIGAMFVNDQGKDEFRLVGKYAFAEVNEPQEVFKKGEGLIGQVAEGQQTVTLNGLDEMDMRLSSSTVNALPKNVIVVPFLFEGKTLGVIELGKLDEFDDLHHEFIRSVMTQIAVAINSAIARRKIHELLQETQRQSEELQSQQEELEEQTQKLKDQQEELQAANEELEEQSQIVEEKNKSLEAARTDIELKAKQLEVSSKYKSEFLANMSHELRTPLNSLLILSNDLLENSDGNLNEEQLESAEIITKSGYDLLNLINDILDLSKIEAGKMNLNVSEFELEELATDIRQGFEKMAKQKGIDFSVLLSDNVPEKIATDQKKLEQVIKNLVSNALKFTEKGKVTVDIQPDVGNNLIIEVVDTGVGIPPDKQALIFEAFQQAEGGTARKYGGTGLGLSISRELARLLGGKITLKSELGKGSTFTLVIPVEKQNETETESKASESKEQDVKPERTQRISEQYLNYPTIKDERDKLGADDHVILIIEDDDDFARILARQASDKGFKYIAASTGEDGLVLARKYQPVAIILDIDLPGISGHTVLSELKGDPNLRHIPVHIMSVNEKTLTPIKQGAVEYITKPVSKGQLEEAFVRIEDFINRKMKNLLILEDDSSLRQSIVKLIGNGDVNCIEAGTGKEAFEQFKKQHIDCLVLDIGLPDMSGFDFIKKIENDGQIKIPPIIVYTGKSLTREENDILKQYAETIIVKGIKSEERLLDETALFLHRTVRDLPASKQKVIRGLHNREEVFSDKKVLLVDDDMRNVFALSKILKERGMDVTKAENGVAALNSLEKDPGVDIVLMDIMMPEMDGYECMRNIRKQSQFVSLPIIALTAKAMKEDRQLCIDAGANDYITKPVDVERLLSLMRVWIKK